MDHAYYSSLGLKRPPDVIQREGASRQQFLPPSVWSGGSKSSAKKLIPS